MDVPGETFARPVRDPDARPVPWQPALGTRNGPRAWLEYFAYRAVLGVLSRVPRGASQALGGALARLARRFERRHTDAARRFLAQALPELDLARREELVLCSWRHFLEVIVSSERLRRLPRERWLEQLSFERTPDIERLQSSQRGALIVTPHLGNWEAAALMLPQMGFRPLYLVVRPQRNLPISRHVQRARESSGAWTIARHGALVRTKQVLRAGGFVAVMPDQRARIAPVVAPFFGRPAHTEQGPAVLARGLKVPILIAACLHDGAGRFKIEIARVFWPEDLAGRSVVEITTAINAELESLIRRYPEQYVWVHDRYYKAPPFEPEPAAE